MNVSVRPLYELHDLVSLRMPDALVMHPKMSGIEEDPRNDWLHVALAEYSHLRRGHSGHIRRAAFIGSANGADVIAALRLFKFDDVTVTDIVPDILPGIERNIRENTLPEDLPPRLSFGVGRDCQPVEGRCDFIYANLPLIMVTRDGLDSDLATTTLTDARAYAGLSTGPDDILVKWSLLPQLGFLLSARDKLAPGGTVVTLIGGRVPDAAIFACFERAKMTVSRGTIAIMRQSDAQYVKEYAEYEKGLSEGAFLFYDEEGASRLLSAQGIDYPSIVRRDASELKDLLAPAALTAGQAWARVRDGLPVSHLSYGFRATLPGA